MLGILDVNGAFALVGMTTNQYSGNNIRSGTTDGRGNYWGAGANSANNGTLYFGNGPASTVQTNVANTIVIQDLGGNLYFSTQKITNGIWKISGTPTTPASASLLIKTGGSSTPYAFAFNPSFTTAYVADDTLTGKGGVQRWDYNGSAWAMSYAFAGITNIGARGVAVDFSGAHPVVYATTAEAAANRLVSITDTGAAATVTTLATAGVNQLFRGVALTPNTRRAAIFQFCQKWKQLHAVMDGAGEPQLHAAIQRRPGQHQLDYTHQPDRCAAGLDRDRSRPAREHQPLLPADVESLKRRRFGAPVSDPARWSSRFRVAFEQAEA